MLQQKEDLRFTISKRIIECYSARFTTTNGFHTEIPVVINKHVEEAWRFSRVRPGISSWNPIKGPGPIALRSFRHSRKQGFPKSLSWLPLIESGFKVRAFSRARALGMWQFIASTGYKFGLKRDRWIDERMDPEKSTKAAIAYLKELHQIFGDWTTALAAYNCGEGTVLRCIQTQKINYLDNFWDLYQKLPRETAFYVPQFLAVLHIINDPEPSWFQPPSSGGAPRPMRRSWWTSRFTSRTLPTPLASPKKAQGAEPGIEAPCDPGREPYALKGA